jgi:hypothetical protein
MTSNLLEGEQHSKIGLSEPQSGSSSQSRLLIRETHFDIAEGEDVYQIDDISEIQSRAGPCRNDVRGLTEINATPLSPSWIATPRNRVTALT